MAGTMSSGQPRGVRPSMPGRISGTIETILRRGACAFRRRPAPVRVRPVPTPTTNWVLSLTRDENVARLANRETAGTEGLRHPKEHTGQLVKPSEAGLFPRGLSPRISTPSALIPRFGQEGNAASPAGSSRFYCRKTSGWGERGGHDTIVLRLSCAQL